MSISWEPSGDRCAVVLGDRRTGTSVQFYSMSGTVITQEEKRVVGAAPSKKGPKPRKSSSCPSRIVWRIQGHRGVCGARQGASAALVFYAPDTCMFDIHDAENQTHFGYARRHDRGNRLVWDPSGRMIASCTITDLKHASARGNVTDGYILYTFQGNVLCNVQCEKLFQFSWRPSPAESSLGR